MKKWIYCANELPECEENHPCRVIAAWINNDDLTLTWQTREAVFVRKGNGYTFYNPSQTAELPGVYAWRWPEN